MGSISGWLLALDGTAGLRGWQWLFLIQGLPAALIGLVLLRCLPDAPQTVPWLTNPEKAWIESELAREASLIVQPARHTVLAPFANPLVQLLGAIGFLLIGANTTLILSAPAVLAATTNLDLRHIGYLVSTGGILGATVMLAAGWHSDWRGDRFRDALVCTFIMAGGFLAIGLSSTTMIVIIGFLAFAAICHALAMLISSAWADVLCARELAVGSAAINTMSQIGAFAMPYAWGAARDATGSFKAGLIGLSVATAMLAALILCVRARITAGRRARTPALAT